MMNIIVQRRFDGCPRRTSKVARVARSGLGILLLGILGVAVSSCSSDIGGGQGLSSSQQALGPITPSPYWKNQVTYPSEYPTDPFIAFPQAGEGVMWVKFTVLKDDLTKVYFQDSQAYPFHGPFAVAHLDPFVGMTLEQFDQVSLHETGQQAILGAVVFAPTDVGAFEYGIQLVRQDAYDPVFAKSILDLVKASIVAPTGTKPFYFPTYEQNASAEANRAYFEANGFPVSSVGRWITTDQAYATGWAYGRLKYFPPDQIDAAYASGALKPEDILLTDSIPAELPYVAGIISLTPSTPNAHTAILATSFGTPFVHIAEPSSVARLQTLVDREIVLRAKLNWGIAEVSFLDAQGIVTPADRTTLLALKRPVDLGIKPKQHYGAISANTDDLGPADIIYFGGKAANYGLLRDAIPKGSQEALGFSFDLWDEFLDQVMPSGQTLRAEISAKLAPYTYPPNLAALKADLAAIRKHIEDDTTFTPAQEAAVKAALAGFDPLTKIRFRSSTNVEDSAVFTGAGLYDSYSGCLADDLDADTAGPSRCEAAEPKERGVFRAIRKAYASFYNDNAFFARLRHRVNESTVGMGLLVHYSYPDENEMANGVTTFAHAPGLSDDIKIVSQLGAESVTNPEGGAQPEVVAGSRYDGDFAVWSVQNSTRVPLGAHVMNFDADYLELSGLLAKVADRFAEVFPGKTNFVLDYEYKKMRPGTILVKQVREVAMPDTTPSLTPYMLAEPQRRCTYQGEHGDAFAFHRVKAQFAFTTNGRFLPAGALAKSIYGSSQASYLVGTTVRSRTGAPSTYPNAKHGYVDGSTTDSFTDGAGPAKRTYTIGTAEIPLLLAPADGPVTALRDYRLQLTVDYATPQTFLDWDGTQATRTNEVVELGTCPVDNEIGPGVTLQTRTFSGARGLSVDTSFYWPAPPKGPTAGYTAPLHRWVQTTIKGLTTKPIVLKGYYSQTYHPNHHNFSEDFLFDPLLEEGIDAATILELGMKGIRQIYMSGGFGSSSMWTVDFHGNIHPWQ
jgi:Pyruvate phosphate dikinase, AMP/ATP-binding domain